ncbi:hypothetical protein SY89_00471 [Halolamina pelagica]|uniref:Uncharacterized protein n=1 Tax=Halolamina pelagica TaxID=699431 RepID=A0A0P7HSU2_9EURY|nr:hypothetical protein [Halolamina pelagica]KPN29754.1 hypothetical protein SY89_00471 [Halolamina pelagica]
MFEQIVSSVTNNPIRYAAPVVAGAFLLITVYQAKKGRRGPEAEFWEFVRGTAIPLLDKAGRALDIGYAAYTVGYYEYAGTLDVTPEEAESFLYEHGFRCNPLSAYKTLPDGRTEQGSWVWRESLLATKQLHVMTFRRDDGSTDCYAHWEYSAINPATALKHYRGVDYSPKKGERKLEAKLPDGSLVKRPPKPAETNSDGSPTAAVSAGESAGGSSADATSAEANADATATAGS